MAMTYTPSTAHILYTLYKRVTKSLMGCNIGKVTMADKGRLVRVDRTGLVGRVNCPWPDSSGRKDLVGVNFSDENGRYQRVFPSSWLSWVKEIA